MKLTFHPFAIVIKCPFLPIKQADAFTIFCFIFISKECYDEEGLIAHEGNHAWWSYVTFGLFYPLLLIPYFRFRFEAIAYAKQLEYSEDKYASLVHFSKILSTGYYLKKTLTECAKMIILHYDKWDELDLTTKTKIVNLTKD